MCDYSLAAEQTDLAKEGQKLTLTKFGTYGSKGFRAMNDVRTKVGGILSWFSTGKSSPCVICIPPGATLMVSNVPLALQKKHNVPAEAKVTFSSLVHLHNTHRDGLLFENGARISLQDFPENDFHATVISLGGEKYVEHPEFAHVSAAR